MQRTHAVLLVHAFGSVKAPTLHVGSNNTSLCSILVPTHATFSYSLAYEDKNLPANRGQARGWRIYRADKFVRKLRLNYESLVNSMSLLSNENKTEPQESPCATPENKELRGLTSWVTIRVYKKFCNVTMFKY